MRYFRDIADGSVEVLKIYKILRRHYSNSILAIIVKK